MNFETNAVEIGTRLRWAREQSGLSQGQAAKQFGMHRPTISQIESGARNLRAEEVGDFANLYDVSEQWILRGDSALEGQSDPRIAIAARELSKLSEDDLETLLRLVKVLRTTKE